MECTLYALLACFNWSSFYIDGGLAVQDRRTAEITREPFGATIDGTTLYTTAVTDSADNPYGRLTLGYGLQFKSVIVALEANHLSSLSASKDRGINSIELRLRWYPFR